VTSTASLRQPGPVRCVTGARTEESIRVQDTAARPPGDGYLA
jgi:hypothetical protein